MPSLACACPLASCDIAASSSSSVMAMRLRMSMTSWCLRCAFLSCSRDSNIPRMFTASPPRPAATPTFTADEPSEVIHQYVKDMKTAATKVATGMMRLRCQITENIGLASRARQDPAFNPRPKHEKPIGKRAKRYFLRSAESISLRRGLSTASLSSRRFLVSGGRQTVARNSIQ